MNLVLPDTGLLFWMVLIFGILFFLLAKFGFPIITSGIEKRNRKIEKSLQEADEISRRLEALQRKQEKILAEASAEQVRMLSEADKARAEIIEQAKADAREEAAKIMAQAHESIEKEKESALRDIRREVALVSVGVAERILRDSLGSDEAQEQYINRLVDEANGK